MSIKARLIQFVLRGKDELSPEAKKSEEALAALGKEADELGKSLDSAKDAQGLVNSLKTTERSIEQAGRVIERSEQQVEELRDALNKSPDSKGLQQSLKDAEREARRMHGQLDKLKVSLGEQESAAKAAGIDTKKLADEEKRLSNEVDQAKQALNENSAQLKVIAREQAAASRSAAEHADNVSAVRAGVTEAAVRFSKWLVTIYLVDKALQGLGAGIGFVKDGIASMLKTGDEFELLDKRIASLMGSIEGGEQAVAWIKIFAKDTPLQISEVTEAFALLKSYGLDPMDGSLQAVVDKNEELGGGMERLQGIASALGQAYAKQKLQTEEILQLVERGVPVWSLLEKVTGKNAAQLQDLATKGRLGRDVIKSLIDEIGKSADGAAAKNMSTLTGLTSNLSDVWSDFLDRISKSGALDFVKQKLGEVAAKITELDKDGRLDKLAQSLSKAFVQGAEMVDAFALKLIDIDFNKLIDDSTRWLDGFGKGVDGVLDRFDTFTSSTRVFWNALTIAGSTADGLFATVKIGILQVAGLIADVLPKSIGGAKLKAAVDSAAADLRASLKSSIDGVKQDADDLTDALGGIGQGAADAAKKAAAGQTAAVKIELEQQRMLDQAHADHLIANSARVKDAAVDAAASGKAAILDLANAVDLIDASKSVQQIDGLRAALSKAYKDGKLSLEEYQQATGVLSDKLKSLGSSAGGAADLVSDLDEKLGDLSKVQSAISSAKTDVDINSIRTALRKLYGDGSITAKQYNDELKKTTERQKELKSAVDQGKKSQDAKNATDKEAIITSEQLRRESGERMAQERRAGDKAMQDRRRGAESVKEDMGAVEDFFGGVLTRSREPLAQLSSAVLDVFDKLNGISTVNIDLDTSSLDTTTESLQRATKAMGEMQEAATTVGTSAFGKWAVETQLQSQRLQVQFLKQKASLQSLEEGYADGSITVGEFVSKAESARRTLGLLNDSDLRTLEGSIESAKQKIEQLAEGSKTTLSSLRDELAQLRGEQDSIDQRRFASRRADINQQLADAQASGDSNAVSNLTQALGTLRQIEQESNQKRQQDEQQKRIDAQKAATAAPATAPAKILRLENAQGKKVDVALQSDQDETNLLDLLQDAGLRAI